VIKQLNEDFYAHNGCKVQQEACYAAGNDATSNKICQAADDYCVRFPLGIFGYNTELKISSILD
jgi:hypothetical protein